MKTLLRKANICLITLLAISNFSNAFANEMNPDCNCNCPETVKCPPAKKITKRPAATTKAKVADTVVKEQPASVTSETQAIDKAVTTENITPIKKSDKTAVKEKKPVITEAKIKAKSTPWIREGYYIEVKGGIDKPSKNTDNFKTFKTDNSAIFEVRGGYNFKDFAIDLAVAHSAKNKLHLNDVEEIFTPNDQFRHRGKIKFTTVSLNAYYNIFNIAGFTPYIGGGAGISRNTTSSLVMTSTADLNTGEATPNGQFVFYKSRQGRSTTNFMWQATIGSRYNVTKDLDLSLEYKYMNLGNWKQGAATAITAIGPEPDKVQKSKLRAQSFLVGVRYYF